MGLYAIKKSEIMIFFEKIPKSKLVNGQGHVYKDILSLMYINHPSHYPFQILCCSINITFYSLGSANYNAFRTKLFWRRNYFSVRYL